MHLFFQNTLKWMLSLLSNQAIFFSKYFYLKNHLKKTVISFSLPWGERIPSLLFIMFSSLLFTPSLFKNFSFLVKHKDFDFFKEILSTLIHKTYLHKKLIWVYIRIAKLQHPKQNLFREVFVSSLKFIPWNLC